MPIPAGSFVDWRIDLANPDGSYLLDLGVGHRPGSLPPEVAGHARVMAAAMQPHAARGALSFRIEANGERYRCQYMSGQRYAARRIRSTGTSLKELGFPSHQIDHLLSTRLKSTGGLILVAGPHGSGKSTTLATLLVERLKLYGGYALTIEDPIEHDLEGFHGDRGGICEQLEVDSRSPSEGLFNSQRVFPSGQLSMLLYGEVRSPEAAEGVLRIARDGHLVMTSIHADLPYTAIQHLYSFAAGLGEDRETLLAESLRYVVHQRITNGIFSSSLLEADDRVRAAIAGGKIPSLKNVALVT